MHRPRHSLNRTGAALVAAVLLFAASPAPAEVAPSLDAGLTQLAADIVTKSKAKDRNKIAVLPFPNTDGSCSVLSNFLVDKLINSLFQVPDSGQTIVERSQLEALLDELEMGDKGLLDASTTQKLGSIHGVQALVLGSITPSTSPFKVSFFSPPGGREQLGGGDMRLTFELGAGWGRFFRATCGFAIMTQVCSLCQRKQILTELCCVSLREDNPVLFWNGDLQAIHRRGNLTGEIVFRYGVIRRLFGMRGAQRCHDDRIEIESDQRETEAKQGGLRVTQRFNFGIKMFFQFLKRRFDAPARPIQLSHGHCIGRGNG
jgi:hypothetical protein